MDYEDKSFSIDLIWLNPSTWVEVEASFFFKVTPWQARANLITFINLPEACVLQRSYSSNSGWVTVGYFTTNTTQYLDIEANNTIYLNDMMHYRLLLPTSKRKTQIVKVHERLNKVAAEISRRHRILLKQGLYGSLCFIFKVHKDGNRCPVCWDEILQQRVVGDCYYCLNTGFEYGFYDPIEAYLSFSSNLSSIQPDVEGASSIGVKQSAWLSSYPILATGDLIVSSDDWEVWAVEGITQTSYKGVLTRQKVDLTVLQGNNPKRSILERISSRL